MSLHGVRFTGPSRQQLEVILEESEASFGASARGRYEALVTQALEDLLADPARVGVREVDGRLHYHLRHSRRRVPEERGRVREPRHVIVARVLGEDLVIPAFGHDSMTAELTSRIGKGEADV